MRVTYGIKISLFVLMVLAVAVLLVGVEVLVRHRQKQTIPSVQRTPSQRQPSTAASSSPPDQTVTWRTYRDENFGFEFRYPLDWVFDAKYEPETRGIRGTDDLDVQLWSSAGYYSTQGIAPPTLSVNVETNLPQIPYRLDTRPTSFLEWWHSSNIDTPDSQVVLENRKTIYLPNGIEATDIQECAGGCEKVYFLSKPTPEFIFIFSSKCFYRNCGEDSVTARRVLESVQLLRY